MIKVLYDGWPLTREANSPEAMHLLNLLRQRHLEVEAHVALPDQPPKWLPEGVAALVQPAAAGTQRTRLVWEQRTLPRLLSALHADLLHLTTRHPPLLGSAACVVSPAEFPSNKPASGFTARVRESMASGGMSRLRGLLWPSDLSDLQPVKKSSPVYQLPCEPYPEAGTLADQRPKELAALNLPETYILYHGPHDTPALRRLLDAWSWTAGPIGEYYPLLILGLDRAAQGRLQKQLSELEFMDTVHPLPVLHPDLIPYLVQGCSAVFHPAPLAPWGWTARLALAYGIPLIAAESAMSDALAGAGAFLLPEGDTRAFGAALITVIVEEAVAERLLQAGRQQVAAWDQRPFRDELFAAYQAIVMAV